jgi:hypothetical protein
MALSWLLSSFARRFRPLWCDSYPTRSTGPSGAVRAPRRVPQPCRFIVQRKALTPNGFPDLATLEARLLAFEALYNDTAVPFRWRFTRQQLDDRLAALPDLPPPRPTPPEQPPLLAA